MFNFLKKESKEVKEQKQKEKEESLLIRSLFRINMKQGLDLFSNMKFNELVLFTR